MNKKVEAYKKVVSDFCEETKHYKNKIEIPSLFLPHALDGYFTATKKCFYVGRDTNGWGSFDDLLNSYEANEIETYIEDGWPKEPDDFLEYSNNRAYGFWTLVSKLQLKINGINDEVSINTNLDEKYKKILSGIGYGNANSIETQKSLISRGIWDDIDQSIYYDIKNKSTRFDKLKYILDIYSPDYIFIFNWDADEDIIFSDLNVDWLEGEHVDKLFSTYKIRDYNTKVIWTVHPTSLRFKGIKIDEFVKLICDRL